MTAFAELDLEARTNKLEAAVAEIRKIGVEGERTEQKVSKSTNAMNVGFGRLAGIASGVVAGLVSINTAMVAFGQAKQFNAAMAETSTLIKGTAEEMAFLEASARGLAKEFGGDATSQVKAFYQAISAGAGSVENAAKLLESANKLAIGGVTSSTIAVDALTTATNAYARSGLTAAQASDAMFVGIKAGKTTAGELSAALGNIVPIASSVGVSFDEIIAGTAALTTQGQSTSMAVTGLRQVLAGVIKPTKEAADMANHLGLQFDTQALQAKGLSGFLEDVIAKTGGSQDAMAQLFGSVEALNAVLAFSGGAGDAFNSILDDMAAKAGATDEAYTKMAESLDQRWNVQMAIARDAVLALGGVLLSVAVPALEALTQNFDMVAGVVIAASAAVGGYGVFAMGSYVASTYAAVGATGLLNAAWKALMINPVAALIGVAVVAAGYLIGKFLELSRAAGGFGNAMELLKAVAVEVIGRIGDSFSVLSMRIGQYAQAIYASWVGTLADMLEFAGSWANKTIGVWVGTFKAIVAAGQNLPAAFASIGALAMNALIDKVSSGISGIVGIFNSLGANIPAPNLDAWKVSTEAVGDFGAAVSGAFSSAMNADYVGNLSGGLRDLGKSAQSTADLFGAMADAGASALTAPLQSIAELKAVMDGTDSTTYQSRSGGGWKDRGGENVTADPVAALGMGSGLGTGAKGGGGGAASDGFKGKIDALTENLRTEREVLDAWYEEGQMLLADRRAMELLGEQGHKDAMLALETEYQSKVAEMRAAAIDANMQAASGFFSDMASLSQSGNKRLAAIGKAFQIAQAITEGYSAAVSAWSKGMKIGGPPVAALFAAGSLVKTGMLISKMGGSGGGASVGGGVAANTNREPTPTAEQQNRFVRLDVQGEGMFADMLRKNGQALVDAITNESKFGGTTIVMGAA